MKVLRYWLLVVLAVLLPVRGGVAAAMPCPVAVSGMQSESAVHPDAHAAMDLAMAGVQAGSHEHRDDQGHGHAMHAAQGSGSHHDHGEGQAVSDQCNMCSAYCSITPLVSEIAGPPLPLAPPSVRFPEISSPAPSFLSDGEERPPRSI